MTLLHAARRLAQRVGLDVHRHDPSRLPAALLARWLRSLAVDLVVDVGANDGGFARELRQARWNGPLLSFEPSLDAHARLVHAARGDPAWHVAPRTALGAFVGAADLHLAGNSTSSSLLPMLPAHVRAAPDSRIVASEAVSVTTLDACDIPVLNQARSPFLKIDTQGYEAPVLDGARQTLGRCVGVQLEMSLIDLYEGQLLWKELHRRLEDAAYELVDIVPGFRDPDSGRLLQFDGVYVRTKASTQGRST